MIIQTFWGCDRNRRSRALFDAFEYIFLLQNNSKVWNFPFSLVSLCVKWTICISIDDQRNALFSGLYCSLYHENARTENDRCQFDNSFDINNLIKIRDTCKRPPVAKRPNYLSTHYIYICKIGIPFLSDFLNTFCNWN